jgi:hypothetical protein
MLGDCKASRQLPFAGKIPIPDLQVFATKGANLQNIAYARKPSARGLAAKAVKLWVVRV